MGKVCRVKQRGNTQTIQKLFESVIFKVLKPAAVVIFESSSL